MENRQVLQTTTKWLSESLMGVHEPPRVDPERFFSMIRLEEIVFVKFAQCCIIGNNKRGAGYSFTTIPSTQAK
jgi:hypothetical protein